MTALTLYELVDEFRAIADQLSDMDLPQEVVNDTLESITLPIEQKCTSVAAFVRNLESSAEQIKQAEAAMAKRRKAIEARAEHVRQYLLDNMARCGMSKIESPTFRISIKQNPEAVCVDDERQIPSEYMRHPPPVPDKALIKRAIADGYEVPGAKLVRGVRLEIKE